MGKLRKSHTFCAICCKYFRGSNVKLFQVPRNELQRQRWNKSCGIVFEHYSKVCENHFLTSDFVHAPGDPLAKRARLMTSAVPSVLCETTIATKLGEDESDFFIEIGSKDTTSTKFNEENLTNSIPSKMDTECIRRENIQSFCCTCLAEIAKLSVRKAQKYNIYKSQDLSKWIKECTQREVKKIDGYPNYLCQECYIKLQGFNEFRLSCIKSLMFLDEVLYKNDISFEASKTLEEITTKTEQCENKDLKTEKDEMYVEETDWCSLNIKNSVSTELEGKEDKTVLITAKIETPDEAFLQNEGIEHTDHNQKLEINDTFEYKNCSDDQLLEASLRLETGNNSIKGSNDIKLQKYSDSSSEESLLIETRQKTRHSKSPKVKKADKVEKAVNKTDKNFHCELCTRRFITAENLAAHVRVHQGLKPHQCNECERSYIRASRLRDHIQIVHTKNVEKLACTFEGCGKVFSRADTLRNHYRHKHLGEPEKKLPPKRIYICEDCGHTSKCSTKFREHRIRHRPVDEYPFKCDQCEKHFIKKSKLKEHQMRHAGIKNFECPHCGMRKTTRNELRTHINFHTKERQWPCSLCTSVFNTAANLRRHDNIVHKGIRSFACNYCDESFGKLETLKHHEMRHTGEKPHKCQICGKCFIQLVALRTHMKTHNKLGKSFSISPVLLPHSSST